MPKVEARKGQVHIVAQNERRKNVALNPGRHWPLDNGTYGERQGSEVLVEFLQTTEIGGEEGSNERSKQWNSQVGGEREKDL